mmetsp:Transcript_33348/g.37877  ORF Transcript_33348/g.37877 Transcript_33348/m.37877 type:complete len:378 (-) Transcript_33348:142-1275(-)
MPFEHDLEQPLISFSGVESDSIISTSSSSSLLAASYSAEKTTSPTTITSSPNSRLIGLLWLAATFMALASTMPIMGALQAETPILKACWRVMILSIGFLPLALREYVNMTVTERQRCVHKLKKRENYQKIVITAFHFLAWAVTGFIGSCMTNFLMGTIYNNLAGLYLVFLNGGTFAKFGKGMRVSLVFIVASVVASVITMEGKSVQDAVLGFLVTGGGAIFGALYIKSNETLTSNLPVDISILLVSSCATVMTIPLAIVFEGATFSGDAAKGIFGLFDITNAPMIPLIFIVAGYGVFKSIGMTVQHLGSEITSLGLLFSPIGSAVEASTLGLSPMPQTTSWLVGMAMMAALAFFTLFSAEKVNDSEESCDDSEYLLI